MKHFYTPSDTTETVADKPGEYPFTRGIHPTMYQGRLWTMRQYAGFGTAQETNKRYKFLLQRGQTGLSVAFDLPTQMGYDSDHQMSRGEVGKTGVAISSLADMAALFSGIPLDKVSVSMTINATAPVLLGMYIVLAERQGIGLDALNGTVQNDILKEYIARGAYIFPPQPSMRLCIDLIEYCLKHIPKWNYISVSGYHIREAGSTAAQEVGFTLADGIAYVQSALERGLDVQEIGRRVSFFFNAHNDLLEEVAKFRAARRLWAQIMKERFKATDPRAMMVRFHTQTAGCTLTAQQPENNVTRVAFQALAAILGGTQSLHTNSFDEALALPAEDAAKLALRTQQLLAHETGVPAVADPLGGSYYIETMTDAIAKKAMEYISEIDKLGGAAKAIEQGYQTREISNSAYEYQKQIEQEQRIIVGVNKYQGESSGSEGRKIKYLKVSEATQRKQVNNLAKYKKNRNNKGADAACRKLAEAARSPLKGDAHLTSTSLMPVILDCIRADATLGEICAVLRKEFGEYRTQITKL